MNRNFDFKDVNNDTKVRHDAQQIISTKMEVLENQGTNLLST